MDTIYLFTRQWFFYERLKSLAKLVLGRPAGGPEAVIASLERGLPELGQNYIINNSWRGEAELAVVLTGAKTLKWAIGQKNKGKIKHLVAGPDVGMPKDNRGLIFDPAIDIFLLPSPWVVEFCSSFNPAFKNKASVFGPPSTIIL